MSDSYIPPLWLERVRGLRFLNPCSGADYVEPLTVFADSIGRFTFNDLIRGYGSGMNPKPELFLPYQPSSTIESTGDNRTMFEKRRHQNLWHRHILPAHYTRRYTHEAGINTFELCWRRGFGQYALQEEPKGQLGVFMHRTDLGGKGRDDVAYLDNVERRHPPLSNLLTQVEDRLAPFSIVVTDGAEASLPWLTQARGDRTRSSKEAFEAAEKTAFSTKRHRWELIGYMAARYAPTLVWGLSKATKQIARGER